MKIPARILNTSGVLIFLLLISSISLLADPPKKEKYPPYLPPPAPMGTVQVSSQVGQTTDDVLEDKGDGSQYVFTAELVLAEDGSDDKWNGMRFDGINVPQGATIQSAYIQFGVSGSSSGTANLKIWGEMSTDAAEFLWTSYGVANRSKTSDSVAWSPPNWPTTGVQGTDQQTPDLSDLVQEIVDQSGWVSGNAMAMFVEGTGTRWAHAYEGSSSLAPILYVTYQTNGNPPSAVASANPTSGTAPLSVSFTGSNSTDDGSISSYAWDFGDGNSSTSADPSHTYTTTDSFSVSLIVTDNEGDKDTASLIIDVSGGTPPTAVVSASPTYGTASLSVSFTGSNSTDDGTITAYAWNFGDGNSSSSADPSHTYTAAGNFTAQLIVTDNQNSKDTAIVAITVSSAGDDPIAVATASPQNGTASLSVSFTGSNSTDDGSITAYAWDFGDTNTSTSADPSHSYTVAGLYVVQLIVTDNENNQDTTELIVGVDSGSGLTQLNSQPGQTTDDVLEDKGDGSQYVFTSELVMAQDGSDDKWNGMRFDGVNVPQGATIQSAYIQFTVSGTSSGTANLKIWGEMSTDADEFLWTGYDIANRSKTTDSVAWSPPDWTTVGAQGADQQTSDLSGLIQEIVDQSGWVSGNAMALFVEGTGTRWAEAYEGSSTLSPKLYITYQNGVPPVAIASASPVAGIAPLTVSFTGSNSTDDGSITAYAWQFGDGKTSSSADPTHTYTKGGSYSAILSTIDNVGLVDRDTVSITVSLESVVNEGLIIIGDSLFGPANRRDLQMAVDETSGNIVCVWKESEDSLTLATYEVYMAIFDSTFSLIPDPSFPQNTKWPILVSTDPGLIFDSYALALDINPIDSDISVAWMAFDDTLSAPRSFIRSFQPNGSPYLTSPYDPWPLGGAFAPPTSNPLTWLDIVYGDSGNLYYAFSDGKEIYVNRTNKWGISNLLSPATFAGPGNSSSPEYYPSNIDWSSQTGLVISYYVHEGDPLYLPEEDFVALQLWDDDLNLVQRKLVIEEDSLHDFIYAPAAPNFMINTHINPSNGHILTTWTAYQENYTSYYARAGVYQIDSNSQLDNIVAPFSITPETQSISTVISIASPGIFIDQYDSLGFVYQVTSYTKSELSNFDFPLTAAFSFASYTLMFDSTNNNTWPELGQSRISLYERGFEQSEASSLAVYYQPTVLAIPSSKIVFAGLEYVKDIRSTADFDTDIIIKPIFTPKPKPRYAVLDWQQHGNLYPTIGDDFYVQYPSRKVPENISFSFYDDATKTWGAIQAIAQATDVGPNKYKLDVTGLTYGKTYLMSVSNSEGEEEYFRIWKRKP